MSWVLWDIVTPLFLAFVVGLTLGWLLWRWRRQKLPAVASQRGESDVTAEKMESINALLIAERDEAVERASVAENNLSEAQTMMHELKSELPVVDTVDGAVAGGVVGDGEVGLSDDAIDKSEKFQSLQTVLVLSLIHI